MGVVVMMMSVFVSGGLHVIMVILFLMTITMLMIISGIIGYHF